MNVDLAALGTAMAVIVGIVNGIALASEKVNSFAKFVIALALGIIFGAFHLFGLTLELGVVAALASSGLYKIASKIGGE